jgi:hypothetical protein
MKKFINEILKPTIIFAIYMVAVAFVSNIIGKYIHFDISIITGVLFLVTYPIYIKFIDK